MPKKGLLEKFIPVLLILSVALAFMVGILWQKVFMLEQGGAGTPTAQKAQPAAANGKLSKDMAAKLEKVSDSDWIRGSKDAQVTIIEYSDLECPYCQQFHPTAKQALEEYGGKIAWVYRQFPLDTIHSRARPAANAAECVGKLAGQEAFWKFVDDVFVNQQTALTDSGLAAAATKAGVASAAFSACYSENRYNAEIYKQLQGGEAAGVTGTPGNFVVNKKGEVWLIPGAVPYATLKATIDEALGS